MTAMTKSQELSILDEAISKLGTGSYLGPWLREVRDEVESMIRSDIFPTEISIVRTNELCLSRIETAHKHCTHLGEEARKAADRMIAEAKERSSAVRATAKKRLQEAIDAIL